MGWRKLQRQKMASGINWSAWLDEHGERLFLYARQQTRTEADAEDVLQEALVQLVQAVEGGSFRGDASRWVPYALAAIRHLAADYGRRAEVRRNYAASERAQEDAVWEETPWLTSSSDSDRLRRQVEGLLRQLPPDFAEVIVLRIWEELTFQQIADVTGAPLPTIASRYRYAIRRMREELERNPIDDHD